MEDAMVEGMARLEEEVLCDAKTVTHFAFMLALMT
jgi:hypothetical protein